jgi:hypothetical protein
VPCATSAATRIIEGCEEGVFGPWAACSTCGGLVRAGDRARLAERGVEAFIRHHPAMAAAMPAGQLSRDVRQRHAGFWTHRIVEEGR